MKIFVSYAFTGEDEAVLRERLGRLRDVFEELNLEYYANIYNPVYQSLVYNNATPMEYLETALHSMKSCDTVLVLNTSERRSEGMLMEIGAAVAWGKKIVLAQHASSVGKTYLPTVADHTFQWQTEGDLLASVRSYFSNDSKS